MSIFSAITLLILTAEIGAYLGSLVSPSLLPASQRRAMVKSLRDASENKQAQSAFVVGAAIVALLFVESAVALASIARENEENGGLKAEALQLWQNKTLHAQKHFITTLFTLVMGLVVFVRLREKNNYIKLLEKYENMPEGEGSVKRE